MAKRFAISIYDLSGNRLCTLFDSGVEQDGAAQDIKIKKEIGGWKEISFNLSKCTKNGDYNFRCDYIRNEYLLYLTEDDETDIYCIKAPAALHDSSKVQFTVSCNHISEELKTKNLQKYFDDENGIGTCEELIERAIGGSGWSLIACDDFYESDGETEKKRSYSCEAKTGAYNMIGGICELFDARPIFHGKDRTIEIRAMTNTDGQMEVLFGKNMSKVKLLMDSSNIVTRLQVEGEYGDYGQIGIDSVNPTGLSFILNFDYQKEIGVFTDEHQEIVDEQIANIKESASSVYELTKEILELGAELNDLIGSYGQAYYPIVNGEINTAGAITGNGLKDGKASIINGDEITIIAADGSHVDKKYCSTDTLNGICLIKFVPTVTGTVATHRDKIKALECAIESYLKKLNKNLQSNGHSEVSIDELKDIYGTDDLTLVNDEEFDLSGVDDAYTSKSMLEYAAAIGEEEKSIADCALKLNRIMLQVKDLIIEIDEKNAQAASASSNQTNIEDAFSTAMGTLLRDGYWSDERQVVGQEQALYNDALEISKKLAYPTKTYTVEIHNLARLKKQEGEDFKLAQAVRIYDPELQINDHGIVSEMVIYPEKPLSDSVTIKTDLLDIGSKSFASILERITSLSEQIRRNRDKQERAVAISKDGKISSDILEGAIDVMKTQLLSSASNWKTDEKGNIIFVTLDGTSAMMLCGNGFMIANSQTTDGDWNWRTFGTGDGFAADLITTGFLSAERIEANSITVNHLAADVGESLDLSSNETINLKVETIVQKELNDFSEPIIIGDEPENPETDALWLDTSLSPNLLKRWNGTAWTVVGDVTDIIDKINTVELRVDGTEGSITSMTSSVDALGERMDSAEEKITADAIVQTVRADDRYKSDLASMKMTAEQFEIQLAQNITDPEGSLSKVSQTADKIKWIIKSGDNASNMEMTDEALSIISENIDITAEKINVIADDIDLSGNNTITVNSEMLSFIGKNISLVGNESITLAVTQEVNKNASKVFRQETQPTFSDNPKTGDLWVKPSTGEIRQATYIEFVVDGNGDLQLDHGSGDGHVARFSQDDLTILETSFAMTVAENGEITAMPATWKLVQDQNILNDAAERVDVEYATGNSNTDAPTTGWNTDAPAQTKGQYIWSRTVTYFKGKNPYINEPICISPSLGKNIAEIIEEQAISNSAGTAPTADWSETAPNPETLGTGEFIWTRSKIVYMDGSEDYTPPQVQAKYYADVLRDNLIDTMDGQTTVYYQDDEPTSSGIQKGDLWYDTNSNPVVIKRYSGTAWVVNTNDTALTKALKAAGDAKAIADGKIVTYSQASEPDASISREGDLWIKTSEGNKLYRYSKNGDGQLEWMPYQDAGIKEAKDAADAADGKAQDAKDTADAAKDIANSKNSTYVQSATPSTSNARAGDIWIDTGNGNRINTCEQVEGTLKWVPHPDEMIASAIRSAMNAGEAAAAAALAIGTLKNRIEVTSNGMVFMDENAASVLKINSGSVSIGTNKGASKGFSQFAGNYVRFGDQMIRKSADGGLVFKAIEGGNT